MSNLKIQKIWQDSYGDYCQSGRLGVNVSECSECGHMEFHKYISCLRHVIYSIPLSNSGLK